MKEMNHKEYKNWNFADGQAIITALEIPLMLNLLYRLLVPNPFSIQVDQFLSRDDLKNFCIK